MTTTSADSVHQAINTNQANEGSPYGNILAVKRSGGLLDLVVSAQHGREILINGNWLVDFASCNYLGFDLHPQVIKAIPTIVEKWGVHPSWARIVASPVLYEELETLLAEFIGVEHTLVVPTVSLAHFGLLRAIAGSSKGLILIDRLAHKTIYDGALLAAHLGAEICGFAHNDLEQVESLLRSHSDKSIRLICVDGVYSMSGNYPPLGELQKLALQYDAIVYVDDAHGLGVIGQKDSSNNIPYGAFGNGIVQHFGISYENVIYVSGLSKAFSSLAAFVACTSLQMKDYLKSFMTPYSHSGPIPTASLASATKALELNRIEGESIRYRLYQHCLRILTFINDIGLETSNDNHFPIISILIGDTNKTETASRFLLQKGILITPGVYPYAPRKAGVVRISITATHTEEEMDNLMQALFDLRDWLKATS